VGIGESSTASAGGPGTFSTRGGVALPMAEYDDVCVLIPTLD
jgi:hypothetical protein